MPILIKPLKLSRKCKHRRSWRRRSIWPPSQLYPQFLMPLEQARQPKLTRPRAWHQIRSLTSCQRLVSYLFSCSPLPHCQRTSAFGESPKPNRCNELNPFPTRTCFSIFFAIQSGLLTHSRRKTSIWPLSVFFR